MKDEPLIPGVCEGTVIAGKYRVERILGAGGMGVVVAARHLQLDEPVALKFLLPEMLANDEAVARFSREARAAVKIKSEHVARVIDVGTLDDGAPFMVMEYLDGSDLSTLLAQQGPLPVEQAIEFVLQASEAVAEAHALGIVHRDLKPANLFITRRADGVHSVKVLDFGISKVSGLAAGGDGSVTKTATLMGSPLYMSPEQMQSARDADARSDIWALGIILYTLLAGEAPFSAETMPELVLKIVSQEPVPLPSKRSDLPPGLEATILKCLEKDRGKRYQTVGELAVALVDFGPKRSRQSAERISGVMRAAGMSASALALPPSTDAPAPESQTMSPFGRTTREPRDGQRTLVGVATVVGLVGLALAVIAFQMVRPSPPPSPSATAASVIATTPPPPVSAPLVPPAESAEPVVVPVEPSPATSAEAAASTSAQPKPVKTATPGQHVAAPPPRKNCDPNYYLDAQGDKHFKPECFAR